MNEAPDFNPDRITTIFYDYDGTLADTAQTKHAAWLSAAEWLWPNYPEWCTYFATLPRVLSGVPREGILYRACYAAPPTVDGYPAFNADNVETLANHIAGFMVGSEPRIMPGARTHLAHNHNRRGRFVVSGAPHEEVVNGIHQLGLTGEFITVQGNADPDIAKTDKLLELMGVFGLDPQECLYIGDTLADMISAKHAGMFGLLFGATTHSSDPEVKHRVSEADYLPAATWKDVHLLLED